MTGVTFMIVGTAKAQTWVNNLAQHYRSREVESDDKVGPVVIETELTAG